jgi:hypothetical protein
VTEALVEELERVTIDGVEGRSEEATSLLVALGCPRKIAIILRQCREATKPVSVLWSLSYDLSDVLIPN